MMILVIHLLVFLLQAKFGFSSKCYKPGEIPPDIHEQQKLEEVPFITLDTQGPMDCLRQCHLYSYCKSANFETSTHLCELLSIAGGNFVSSLTYSFINGKNKQQHLLKSCQNHNCPIHTYCQDGLLSFICVPFGCTGAPTRNNVNVSSFMSKKFWNITELVPFPCEGGYYPGQNVYCNNDGEFTGFKCLPFTHCGVVRYCENFVPEADYLVFQKHLSVWVYFFCRRVSATFISLHHPTISTYSIYTRQSPSCSKLASTNPPAQGMGSTEFWKVRMKLNIFSLKNNIVSYASTNFTRQELGSAGDCYTGNDVNECGVLGYFKIDLRDTGLRIKSDVEWVLSTNESVIYNLTWSYNNQVIEGHCGGNCGGCEVNGDFIPVEVIPGYVTPTDPKFACSKLIV